MKQYENKIEGYKKMIQTQYIRETAVESVIKKCEGVMGQIEEELYAERKLSFFEFLYEQSKFIQKRWWVLQGVVLFALLIMLSDVESIENALRTLPIMAVMFSVLIIPEMWKNQRFSAIEIEKTAFYSLRQIFTARILLFGLVDLAMMTLFFVIVSNTFQIDIYKIIINFLIPFNVSCCICFRLLYSKWHDIGYVAVFLNLVCIVVWSAIAGNDFIYQKIAMPIWIGMIVLSFGYLVYCVQKSQRYCELIWGGQVNGITI